MCRKLPECLEFFINADDQAELWLSIADDPVNKKRTAIGPQWNSPRWMHMKSEGGNIVPLPATYPGQSGLCSTD